MPRSIWSGALSFGLVTIPVKLVTATSPKDIHFHLLHDKDGVRIRQKRVCPVDGQEVSSDHIVKGYEISPDHYVTIKPEELDALDPKATHTIDIEDFVALDQIDPIYFEHSYYLTPGQAGEKAYRLLYSAMKKANKVAIARIVIRTKQYLAAIRAGDKALILSTMLFSDEVVPQDVLEGLPAADTTINERELAMADQLIDSLSTRFDPKKYHDDYRDRVLALIERKAEGQEIVVHPQVERETAKVINLMDALEASLAASKRAGKTTEAEAKSPAKPRRRKA